VARIERAAILDGVGYKAVDSARGEAQLNVMAPLARAYELSVPERPKDGGLFGPGSQGTAIVDHLASSR